MAKAKKTLAILVHPYLADWYEWDDYAKKGFTVHISDPRATLLELDEYDIIIGPTCWNMDDSMRPFLELAIKEAQKRRYPPTKDK